MKDIKRRKDDEIHISEHRHGDTINALRSLHVEEINAVRERGKDKIALEQLSGQITNTSGSIKLIEEQLDILCVQECEVDSNMDENILTIKNYKIEPIIEHEEHEIYIGSTTKKYSTQR